MKTIKVTDCGDCPFISKGYKDTFCNHEDSMPNWVILSEIPYWCPLKKESVKIELID